MTRRLEPVVPSLKLVGERKLSTHPMNKGEWQQEVAVEDRRYRVTLRRGKRVKIAYRGNAWGCRWVASVWSIDPHGLVWDGEVPGSIGARGILLCAGIVVEPSVWWDHFLIGWFFVERAVHGAAHPGCRVKQSKYNDVDTRLGGVDVFAHHKCDFSCTTTPQELR